MWNKKRKSPNTSTCKLHVYNFNFFISVNKETVAFREERNTDDFRYFPLVFFLACQILPACYFTLQFTTRNQRLYFLHFTILRDISRSNHITLKTNNKTLQRSSFNLVFFKEKKRHPSQYGSCFSAYSGMIPFAYYTSHYC